MLPRNVPRPPTDERPLLDAKAAAKILNASPKTLEGWRWKNLGPEWIKLGRVVRYRPSAIEAYLDAATRTPRQPHRGHAA
jgi:hypothetical protein